MPALRLTRPADVAVFVKWFPIFALGDISFVLLDVTLRAAVHFGYLSHVPPSLFVTSDDGVPEIYDYAKWVLVCGVLIAAFLRTRGFVFLALAGTFLTILADDSLQLHERFGAQFAALTGMSMLWGLRMQDFGELAVWAFLGVFIVSLLFEGFRRSSYAHRALGMPFLYAFFGLLFVAIGLDMAHSEIETLGNSHLSVVFGLLEDGSEMLLASLAGAYAISLAAALGLGRDREIEPHLDART